jgi:hypothetical protein
MSRQSDQSGPIAGVVPDTWSFEGRVRGPTGGYASIVNTLPRAGVDGPLLRAADFPVRSCYGGEHSGP